MHSFVKYIYIFLFYYFIIFLLNTNRVWCSGVQTSTKFTKFLDCMDVITMWSALHCAWCIGGAPSRGTSGIYPHQRVKEGLILHGRITVERGIWDHFEGRGHGMKHLVQTKCRGEPCALLVSRLSVTVVKVRFHSSLTSYFSVSSSFLALTSPFAPHVPLNFILHNPPCISSVPPHPVTWAFSKTAHDQPTFAHVWSLSVSLWFLIILFWFDKWV